jgi:hypothetical protein
VQWGDEFKGAEYTDWVPVGNVTILAVEEFNPAPGLHGKAMAASAQATQEWARFRHGGTVTLHQGEGTPFYNNLAHSIMMNGIKRALRSRPSTKKRAVAQPLTTTSSAARAAGSSARRTSHVSSRCERSAGRNDSGSVHGSVHGSIHDSDMDDDDNFTSNGSAGAAAGDGHQRVLYRKRPWGDDDDHDDDHIRDSDEGARSSAEGSTGGRRDASGNHGASCSSNGRVDFCGDALAGRWLRWQQPARSSRISSQRNT